MHVKNVGIVYFTQSNGLDTAAQDVNREDFYLAEAHE